MSNLIEKRKKIVKAAMNCRVELIAYARSLIGDYSTAEDVVQQAFLVVFDKFEQFREGSSMLAWCRVIVRIEVFRLRDVERRERTLASRLLDDVITSAYEEFQTERRITEAESWRRSLRYCLKRISERGRGVMRARFVDGLSYQQIAEHLGMKIEAVRKSLYRDKQKLRSCVEAKQRQGS